MRRDSLVLGVLLAAAVLGGLALWLRDDAAVEAALRSDDVGRPASEGRGREERTALGTIRAPHADSSESSGPTFAPVSARAPTTGGALELAIVEGATRRPVADARVVWWSPPGSSRRERILAFEAARRVSRLDELFVAEGIELVSDAEGRALAPWSDVAAFACASLDGRWGYALVDSSDPAPHFVELERDFDVDVRVVDEHGAPVEGARVELQRDRWSPGLVAATTAADGSARLEHCGPALRSAGLEGGPLEIVLAEVLGPRVSVACDALAPPTKVVELRAPAFGRLDVRIVDPRGVATPAVREVELELSAVHEPSPFDCNVTREVRDGVARFEMVAVDCVFVATARLDGSMVSNHGSAAGPRAAGEHAVLNLIVGNTGVVVRGRAVSPNGVALAHALGRLQLEFGESDLRYGASCETDRDGRLLCELIPDALVGARAVVLDVFDEAGRLAGRARRELSTGHLTTPVELGELVVDAPPVFAAGRVVDAAGAPVVGALVTLLEPLTHRGSTGWEVLPNSEGRSDAAGRFELHGEPPGVVFEAFASRGALRSGRVQVRRGDAELRLELVPTGVIEGRLALDAWLPTRVLEVHAETSDEPALRLASSAVDADGRFVLRGVPPGEVRVALVAREDSEFVLASLASVRVEPAMATRDPRLEPWDVRALRRVELSFVDEFGAPVEEVEIALGSADSSVSVVHAGSASFHVYSTVDPIAWCAYGDGLLALRHQGSLEDRTFVLRRAPTVRFELAEARAHPELDFSGTLRSEVELGIARDLVRWLEFDPQGVASTQPGALGRTRLELTVRRRGSRQVAALEALSADIPEAAGGDVVIPLSLDPAKFEAALQRLER